MTTFCQIYQSAKLFPKLTELSLRSVYKKIWQFAKYLPALQWPCCQSKGFFVLVTIFSGDHSLEVVSHSDLVHIPACMSVVNIFVFVIVSYQLDRSRFFRCSLALLLSLSRFLFLTQFDWTISFWSFCICFFLPEEVPILWWWWKQFQTQILG